MHLLSISSLTSAALVGAMSFRSTHTAQTARTEYFHARIAHTESLALAHDIIGTDDRRLLTPQEERDFSGIGALVCKSAKLAHGKSVASTGSVVMNADIVLTNAHGLWAPGNEGRYDPIRDCKFLLLTSLSEISFESTFTVFGVGPTFESGIRADASDDWAILRLDEPVPVGTTIFGYHRYRLTEPDRKVRRTLVGTPFDKKSALYRKKTISDACSVWQVSSDEAFDPAGVGFLHDCDTEGGMSGSPLLIKKDGTYYVEGLHVSDAVGVNKGKYNRGVRMDCGLYEALAAATGRAQ